MCQSIRIVSVALLCVLLHVCVYAQQDKKNAAVGNRAFDSLLHAGKENLAGIVPKVDLFDGGMPKVAVKNAQVGVQYGRLQDTSGISTGMLSTLYSTMAYQLSADVQLWQLPFHAQVKGNNGLYTIDQPPFNSLPAANFDHQQYMETIRKNVMSKVSPEQVMSSNMSRINAVKTQYEQSLRNDISKMQGDMMDRYHTTVNIPDNATDLSQNDMASLKRKLIPEEAVTKYQKSMAAYQELNESNRQGQEVDSMRKDAMTEIKKYEALEKTYNKIAAAKGKFENNDLVKQVRSQMPFQPSDYKTYLKNPSQLANVAREHASLSSLQSLFMNVSKLDMGTNPVSGGQFNYKQLMNTGVNTEFTNARSSIGAIYGSGGANQNKLLQAGLDGFVSNEYSQMAGVKLGSGWNNIVKQSVSFNLYSFKTLSNAADKNPFNMQAGNISSLERQDAVITYQTSLNIAPEHTLAVDLSQSFGSYKNTVNATGVSDRKDAASGVFSGDGISNYALSLDYQGTVANTDLQAYLKKAGAGYNNPGNVFVRKGETRTGLGFSRRFLAQKLSVKYKADYRTQNFDPAQNYTYSNFSNQLQFGYKQSKTMRLGLTFRDNSYAFNNEAAGMHTNGYTYNVQGDANYQVKIDRKRIMNTFLISRQNFEIPVVSGETYQSHTWLINHTSSVLVHRNLLTATLSINQSDNKDYYFNTSFVNTEFSYAYNLGGLHYSSGIGYYVNSGWNKQLGVRQQVGGQLWSKMTFDIDITCKKAVQIIRQSLADQFFVNASVNYQF